MPLYEVNAVTGARVHAAAETCCRSPPPPTATTRSLARSLGTAAVGRRAPSVRRRRTLSSLSNSPSATVAGPPPEPAGQPLTASFSNVPDEHSGSDVYFDLTFSEEPDVGYRDVQRAFRVSGGSINRASRKSKGSNLG